MKPATRPPAPAVQAMAKSEGGGGGSKASGGVGSRSASSPAPRSGAAFVSSVQAVANDAPNFPGFTDRVAIVDAYDAFRRKHSDAPGFGAFKDSLVQAHNRRELTLRRVDRAYNEDRRAARKKRESEIVDDGLEYHAILRR